MEKPLLLLALMFVVIRSKKNCEETRKRTLLRVFSALMVVAGALIIASQFA